MALSINTQPDSEKIIYSKSPVIYMFTGGSTGYTYRFKMYISTAPSPTDVYATIVRQLDLNYSIIVDASNLIRSYMRNYNLSFTNDNIIYIKGELDELEDGVVVNTVTSDPAVATLGYVGGEDGYNIEGNSVGFNISQSGSYLMMSNQPNKLYSIPNYNNSSYWLVWRSTSTGEYAKINYYTTNGTSSYKVVFLSSSINRLYCGYYDLENYYYISNVDTNKNIEVEIYSAISLISTYILYPENCRGNELYKVQFMNKYGMWELLYMDGKNQEEITYDSQTYKFNRVDYSNMNYDFRYGTYHKFNSTGKGKLMLETGWLDEVKNEKIKDLHLSEFILINNKPYILTDKSFRYKTDKYDKIINYNLTFEKAYDTINNIR